ncbi:MAG TPA: hypothetical protein VJZ26_00345 [Blastocatellia bacterium]|nr:hypothetical protein [Blastocatellia bacterium]
MQRPPDRRSPQVLFSRPTNEWINRVGQKHKQFAELQLSDEEKTALKNRVEAEFVYSTLRLEGIDVSRGQVARLAAASPDDLSAVNKSDLPASALLRAIRKVEDLAETEGRSARLTPELLVSLNEAGFRNTPGDAARPLKPTPAEHLGAAVESACRWYAAESFEELNPVEQASIVLLRLAEIQPFEQANLATALAAASLLTLRSQLPPVIIRPENDAELLNALEESSRMNTRPTVELIAREIEKTLDEMIDQGRSKKQK